MPNYIYNRLTLECVDSSILDRFYEENRQHGEPQTNRTDFHDETVLSFGCQVPVAKGESEIGKWGCKWDASDPVYDRLSPAKSEYRFTTPWSAPINWLHTVSKKYPEIKFTIWYECEGLTFIGKQTVNNGISKLIFVYRLAEIPQYFKAELGINLADLYNRITIAAKGDDTKLICNAGGDNDVLAKIIWELGLDREFEEIIACVVLDVYMELRKRLDIDYLEEYK